MEIDWWVRGASVASVIGTVVAATFAAVAALGSRRASDAMSQQLHNDRQAHIRGLLEDIASKVIVTWDGWRRSSRSTRVDMWALRTAVSVCLVALPGVQPFTDSSLDGAAPDRDVFLAALNNVRAELRVLND